MTFDVIGIAFVVILLIFLIAGLHNGFLKILFGFIKTFGSAIIAALASKPAADLLLKTKMVDNFSSKITNSLLQKDEIFAKTYGEVTDNQIFTYFKIPDSIANFFKKITDFIFKETGDTSTVAEVLGKTAIYYASIVILFIIIFIVIRIICTIMGKLSKKVNKAGAIGLVNRILGGTVNFFTGLIFVCIICYGLTMLINIPGDVSTWIITTMKLEEETFTLSKLFYNHNFLAWLISIIQNIF